MSLIQQLFERKDNINDMSQEVGSSPRAAHLAEKTDHLRA